jgi:hypothetical protein
MKMALTMILLITLSVITSQVAEMDRTKEKRMILDTFMDRSPKELFKAWHLLFKREYTYETEEAKNRFKIFKENLAKIKEHNKGNNSYKVGLNQFSDMSNEEFKEKYTRYRPSESVEHFINTWQEKNEENGNKFLDDDDDDLTKRNLSGLAAINWTSLLNKPRDQVNCGGCWAFSISTTVEAAMAKTKNLGKPIPYLSIQQLLDCNTSNYGCNGGDLSYGLNYSLNTGLEYDSNYPYLGYSGNKCYYNSGLVKATLKGYSYCSNQTTAYKCSTNTVYNLLTRGPLSVVTNGGSWAFQNYSGGLFNAACYNIDHAVTLVGYGVSGTTPYWLVRNSWGPYWGESGYLRIVVNTANNYSCFIESSAFLPLV